MKNKDDFKLEIPVVFGGGAPAISTYRYQQQAIERNRLQNQQMNNFATNLVEPRVVDNPPPPPPPSTDEIGCRIS